MLTRGRLVFEWFIIIYCCLSSMVPPANSYIEYVEDSACENCTLRLTCRTHEFITIIHADFNPEDLNLTTYFDDFNAKYPPLHPRFALIKRCSGVNYCSFILSNDCPDSLKWGPGNLIVKYGCIEEARISRYCNEDIRLPVGGVAGVSVGVIQNPGYPRYYLGHAECRWRIRAPPTQKIKLTILDLSLIGDSAGCTDQLLIHDGSPATSSSSYSNSLTVRTAFAGCEDTDAVTTTLTPLRNRTSDHDSMVLLSFRPLEILSVTETVEIALITTVPTAAANVRHTRLTARRGILVQYEAVGCTEVPATPLHGYRVYRNDTHVTYACCVDYAFPASEGCRHSIGNVAPHDDELVRFTSRECRGNRWFGKLPIPDCIAVPRKSKNLWKKMTESSYSDVLVPSIIMALLLLINGVIIFVIYKYRQRNDRQFTVNAEEMGVLPTKRIGN